jgi:plasmid maintenance system antidote protein VapI
MQNPSSFGKLSQDARHKRGVTVGRMADILDISAAQVCRIEWGRVTVSDDLARDFAYYLGGDGDKFVAAAREANKHVAETQSRMDREWSQTLARLRGTFLTSPGKPSAARVSGVSDPQNIRA